MDEKEIIKLFAYMITSARGCVLEKNNLIGNEEVSKIIEKIEDKKYSCMTDEKEFVTMLDNVIDDFVALLNFNKK